MDLQQSDKEIKAQSATSSDGSVWANGDYVRQQVIEDRPDELDCDVVRFQNNKDKWVLCRVKSYDSKGVLVSFFMSITSYKYIFPSFA